MKQLLRVAEAARSLNTSRARCYEFAPKGHLSVVRLGRRIRFDPEQLKDFLANGGFRLAVPSAEERTCAIHVGLATRHTLRFNSHPHGT